MNKFESIMNEIVLTYKRMCIETSWQLQIHVRLYVLLKISTSHL